ncbi:MAG: carboxypeptidase regulatory-like domain-containing protein, partial [Planctomycetia bacterium]|nr:carboxypeptidase regulatory-like domain-containing protein [Planctomycetia bacterium]
MTEFVDPSEKELTLNLEPMPTNLPPDRMLRGRVVNEGGRPVAGALVGPTGAKTSDRRWRGALPGVDEASVTDDEGRFVITSRDPKLGLDLAVAAPGFAIQLVELLALNGEEHEIRLQRGATVKGGLMSNDKPVAGRAVGVVQRDRSSGKFVGETTLATDDQGQFIFPNLQPNDTYVLYTLCSG